MTPKSTLVILSHFANLKLAGDRAVSDAVKSLTPSPPNESPAPRQHTRPRRRRRGRTRVTSRSTSRVHAMSDADLEAELAARRDARSKERERYARAMRSEKLTVLESELLRLRSEISRLDRGVPLGVPLGGSLGGGTPPTSRWESLPPSRRSREGSMPSMNPMPATPMHGGGPGGPPPPPGPPPMEMQMDPEKQKREKEERQRRREAKRKEREANKKPLTLADIIKGAGPNPAGQLKPKGSVLLDGGGEKQEEEHVNEFASMKDALKKAKPVPDKEAEKEVDATKLEKSEAGDSKAKSDGEAGKDANEKGDVKTVENKEGASEKGGEASEKGDDTSEKGDSSDKGDKATASRADTEKGETSVKSTDRKAESTTDVSEKEVAPTKAGVHKDGLPNGNSKSEKQGPPSTQNTNTPEQTVDEAPTEANISDKPAPPLPSPSPPPPPPPPVQDSETNGASDAISAISALAGSLQAKKKAASPEASSEATPRSIPSKSRKRMSLDEKRKLRRAASSGKDDAAEDDAAKSELKDVMAAASALKID